MRMNAEAGKMLMDVAVGEKERERGISERRMATEKVRLE